MGECLTGEVVGRYCLVCLPRIAQHRVCCFVTGRDAVRRKVHDARRDDCPG